MHTLHSYPLTPTLRPNSSVSTTPLRADSVGAASLPTSEWTADRWFNLSAFRVPPAFTFGNCGRNVLRGPGFVNVDVLLGREFESVAISGSSFARGV